MSATQTTSAARCILTIDVEDWFHILDLPSTPGLAEWDGLESRVERNFLYLLDALDQHRASATCFFLGWVAERFPHLVCEAHARGHEIASHGYAHRLVYTMSREEFLGDTAKAKDILEDIAGEAVHGYRATGWSVTERTPWFFDCLCEAGHEYDSSVFPARRGHGGMPGAGDAPHIIQTESGNLVEFPQTVANALGARTCFFGGGYLRLFPYWLIKRMTRRVLADGRPVLFYVHPREIDPRQPRLPMNPYRRFKSYVNLGTTERKLHRLLDDFDMTTCREYLDETRLDTGTTQ